MKSVDFGVDVMNWNNGRLYAEDFRNLTGKGSFMSRSGTH